MVIRKLAVKHLTNDTYAITMHTSVGMFKFHTIVQHKQIENFLGEDDIKYSVSFEKLGDSIIARIYCIEPLALYSSRIQ